MSLNITTRVLTLPALIFSGFALTACSAQGYGHGSQLAGANCLPPAQSCNARYAAGQYGYDNNGGGTLGAGQYNHGINAGGKTRYGTSYQVAGYQQSYVAQQQLPLAPMYQPQSYAPAAQAVDVEIFAPTTSYAAPANCPAGTTAQADGTCLQGSSTMSYTSTASYTGPSYSTSSMSANCPAGTTAQSDGTCLQGSSSTSYVTSSASSYSPSYDSSSTIAPPISEYNWGSSNITWGDTDYVSPGTRTVDAVNAYPTASSATTSSYSYQPVRK